MTVDDLPLSGKHVLVTRSRDQAGSLIESLEAAGARVTHLPVIRFVAPPSWDSLDEVIDHPDRWRWLVFTSTNGVESFFERMNTKQVPASAFVASKIAAVGKATAAALEAHGLVPDVVPDKYRATELLPVLPDNQIDVATAIVRAREGRDDLIEALRRKGGNVHLAIAYETTGLDHLPDEIRTNLVDGSFDALTFTSPSTVEHLLSHLTSEELERVVASVLFASIGPTTTDAIRARSVKRMTEATVSTVEGLCQAVVEALRDR